MADAEKKSVGYHDTPFISGNPWRVHDGDRPQPRVVTPGEESLQEKTGAAPSDAVMLFDGTDLSQWKGGKGDEAAWKVENGYMEVVPKSGNISTKAEFGDCQLHLEYMAPAEVKGEGQGRGNSGIFMMGLYEIQVLDNYDNPTYADGTCGALYGQCPPLVNACRKPGEWQTYDIVWIAPRFDDRGMLVSPAYVTVMLNGIILHNKKELIGPTNHKTTTCYKAHPATGPLELQDHGDLVRYRNIWYRPLNDYDE